MKTFQKISVCTAALVVASFSLAGLRASAMTPAEGAPYTVYMAVSAGTEQQWNPGEMTSEDATISSDGDYSCSVTFSQGSGTIEYLSLDSNINVYSFVEEGGDPFVDGTAKIVIKSIEIQHVDGTSNTIEFQLSDTSLRTSDDGKCLRYSLLDNWGAGTHENNIDQDLSAAGGLGEGDKLVVNFTISGIESGGGTATDDTTDGTTDGTTDDTSSDDTTAATTTAASDDNTSSSASTTTAAGGSSSTSGTTTANSKSGSSSSNSSSSGSSGSGSGSSSSGSSSTDSVSETADVGISAIVLGAIATAALAAGAVTITRRKK